MHKQNYKVSGKKMLPAQFEDTFMPGRSQKERAKNVTIQLQQYACIDEIKFDHKEKMVPRRLKNLANADGGPRYKVVHRIVKQYIDLCMIQRCQEIDSSCM